MSPVVATGAVLGIAGLIVEKVRDHHQPIPEGSGGTGDTTTTAWNGPCRVDLEVWPCVAEQAAQFIERHILNKR
jgi:hypothetical protein